MKVEIHSFKSLQERAKTPFAPKTSLISIGDPDALPPVLQNRPDHIMRLVFDDLTPEIARERMNLPPATDNELVDILKERNAILFTDKMAEKAAGFIIRYRDDTDLFLCQCEFGQSRSSACAAAILEFFHGEGERVFNDKRYVPNSLVYSKLLAALKKAGEA